MRISFVIPTYNTRALTEQCLDSLIATVNTQAHEIIIIDDTSTDGTREYLRDLPSTFKIILNARNQGYGKNCNQASRIAQGEVLCFCNSDIIFLPGWLPPLIEALQTLNDVGFIGNIQRSATTGRIDHVGVRFLPDGRPLHIGWGRAYPPIRKFLPVSAVTAACCVIRKDLFIKFDGFSDLYINGFEDTDLCLRLGEKGYHHYVATKSTVLHYVSASPNRKNHEDHNLAQFLKTWQNTVINISIRERTKWNLLEILLDWRPVVRIILFPFIRLLLPMLASDR